MLPSDKKALLRFAKVMRKQAEKEIDLRSRAALVEMLRLRRGRLPALKVPKGVHL